MYKTSSVGTEIIPRTYHKDCIRRRAETILERSFSCMLCDRPIPREELFSKIEVIMQKIKLYKMDMLAISNTSIIMGFMLPYTGVISPEMNSIKKIGYFALNGVIIFCLSRISLNPKVIPLELGILSSALISTITSVVSESLRPSMPSIPLPIIIGIGAISAITSIVCASYCLMKNIQARRG